MGWFLWVCPQHLQTAICGPAMSAQPTFPLSDSHQPNCTIAFILLKPWLEHVYSWLRRFHFCRDISDILNSNLWWISAPVQFNVICPVPSAYTPYDLHETFSHRSHFVPIFCVKPRLLYSAHALFDFSFLFLFVWINLLKLPLMTWIFNFVKLTYVRFYFMSNLITLFFTSIFRH